MPMMAQTTIISVGLIQRALLEHVTSGGACATAPTFALFNTVAIASNLSEAKPSWLTCIPFLQSIHGLYIRVARGLHALLSAATWNHLEGATYQQILHESPVSFIIRELLSDFSCT